MYYLQSRYYNPEWGRFINADALVSTGQGILGNNMFAYCRNNPVRRIDISGMYDLDCNDVNPNDDELVHEEGGRRACNTANNANSGHTKAPNSSSINNYSNSRSGRPGSMHSSSYGGTGSSGSKHFTPDQQAVIELAKASKSTGLSASEAEILYGWAQEYGIPGHGPMIHHGRSGKWGYTLHINIMNYHIAIND